MPGTLFLVATPLGNPSDLSSRAIETMRTADVLYAEDTRTAKRLLVGQGIHRTVLSCHDNNEQTRSEECRAHLQAGQTVALISEAGTPAVSDPGFRMVRAAIEAGAPIVPIPGPSAVLAALVGSGLPTDRFYFGGFLPRKAGPRRAALQAVVDLEATLIFFESPLRTADLLQDCLDVLGDRPACVARELTKTHEEFVRGTLSALRAQYAHTRPLGEITLVVHGKTATEPNDSADREALRTRARALLDQGHSARDVTQRLVLETALPKRTIYTLVLDALEAAPGDAERS